MVVFHSEIAIFEVSISFDKSFNFLRIFLFSEVNWSILSLIVLDSLILSILSLLSQVDFVIDLG